MKKPWIILVAVIFCFFIIGSITIYSDLTSAKETSKAAIEEICSCCSKGGICDCPPDAQCRFTCPKCS